jgi:long-chain fatty acid transport protein
MSVNQKSKHMKKLFTSLILTPFFCGVIYASGYQVMLQGNRTTAMGNLGTAMYRDASSLFFNPGAMAFVKENGAMVGFNPIFASNTYWDSETTNSSYTVSTDNPMGTPFHAYVVWGPEDGNIKFGLGAFTPFGSGVNWGDEWTGRDLLNELTLRAIQIQPTISYKISDKFSIGAGLDVTIGSVKLQRTLLLDGRTTGDAYSEGSVTLDGQANTAFGYNIGIFYQPSDRLDIGLSYRSEVTMKVEDSYTEFLVPSGLASQFPDGNRFGASLPLPSVITAGLTYHINEKFNVGAQFDWVGWSAYESLDIDFEQNTALLEDSSSPRQYEDSWVAHLGGEYILEGGLALRAGFYYDTTPVQDGYMTAETPDNDRIGLTAGLGYDVGAFVFDLSFLYIHSSKREQTTQHAIDANTYNPEAGSRDVLPGTYRLNALIPGISIGYKF